MSYSKRIFTRPTTLAIALMFGTAVVQPGFAADQAASPNVTLTLINRLVERGVLAEEDAADLRLVAEADAAEARAQAALTQAALAQAAAAEARLRVVMGHAGSKRVATERIPARTVPIDPPARETEEVEPLPAPAPVQRTAHVRPPSRTAPSRVASPKPAPESDPGEQVAAEETVAPTPPRVASAAKSSRATTARANPAQVEPPVSGAAGDEKEGADADEKIPDDTVRVTYVPEVVKAQLREEIKNEVMDQAREENWASPHAFPDWVSKLRLFGDLRVRYESMNYPVGSDNSGVFLNFNAVNTGAPYDSKSGIPFPTLNVDQDRRRVRLRARMGASVDMGQNFSGGLRLATGENNSPVSQNQSFGAAGNGQGGNFSKYAVWLDRAFLRYETGGLPDKDFSVSLGRFDNPFFSTSMIWADDLGFDGAVAQGRFGITEDVTPFYAVGAFPVFNTDLNFSSIQAAKFKSDDKWLYGAQLGVNWELGKDVSLKLGAAFYQFDNIEGKLSSPIVLFSASDAGDTDSSRPAFAQKGNTYMALRDILSKSGEPADGGNRNGTINRFQYFGLASKFAVAAIDARLDFNQFEPFQISLYGELAKNRKFDAVEIEKVAENNLGAKSNAHPDGEFTGTDTAWIVGVTVGDVALKERWKWNVNLNYRRVGSDALVDGFVDSDFGGGGTNMKGFTIGGNLALSANVKFGVRWMSAKEVTGYFFKNDILQVDFSGKF